MRMLVRGAPSNCRPRSSFLRAWISPSRRPRLRRPPQPSGPKKPSRLFRRRFRVFRTARFFWDRRACKASSLCPNRLSQAHFIVFGVASRIADYLARDAAVLFFPRTVRAPFGSRRLSALERRRYGLSSRLRDLRLLRRRCCTRYPHGRQRAHAPFPARHRQQQLETARVRWRSSARLDFLVACRYAHTVDRPT